MSHLIPEYQLSLAHAAAHSHTLEESGILAARGYMWDTNSPYTFGKEKVENASESDFMGPNFMGHQGFLKHFHAVNPCSLEQCLKSQQGDDARDVCFPHEQPAFQTTQVDLEKCS